ncbi:hypothetical protein E7Z53_19285 [Kocuria salina]|uniref:hypothetical protein n=1 Tax=Kocuria salina TaxID=1929416 RepID=UPI001594D1EC|nr:hypothetical protein [Kocuria salina]NVC25557.1 hypothetical protein [Kocuria salina]
MSTVTGDVVHPLYIRPGDLVPYCGVTPAPDSLTGNSNTGHSRDELLECMGFGLPVCMVCAYPDALGGSTPLMRSEDGG